MTIYLVDYENVHDAGMKYSERIPEDSIIHLFFSNAEDKITLGSLAPIVSRLHLHKTRAGKQSLDMHLASYLGHEIGVNGAEHNYIIVSKDRDYDNIAMFWCEHGIRVSSQGALVSKNADDATSAKQEVRATTLSRQHTNRTLLRNNRSGNAKPRGSAVSVIAESAPQETASTMELSENLPDSALETAPVPNETLPLAENLTDGSATPVVSPAEPEIQSVEPDTAPDIETEKQNSLVETASETLHGIPDPDTAADTLRTLTDVDNTPQTMPVSAEPQANAEQTASTRRQQNNRYNRRGRTRQTGEYRNRNRNTETTVQVPVSLTPADSSSRRQRTPTPPSEKTLLNNRVMTKLTEAKLEAAVVGKATAVVMKKFGTPGFKQAAYRELIKTFGMKDGLSYYNILKLIF